MIQSRQVQLVFILLVALLLGTGFMHGKSLEKDRELVQARNQIFMETFKNMDSAALAKLYTTDAKVLLPYREPVEGVENLEAFWQTIIDSGVDEIRLHTGNIESYGKILVEIRIAELLGEDGGLVDTASYIVIWKQERGTWKMYLDNFNGSLTLE